MHTVQRFAGQALSAVFLLAISAPLHPVAAEADVSTRQVAIEARTVEMSGEFLLNLGVGWNNVKGKYSSTGGQEPAHESSRDVFGTIGLGGNIWFNTGLGGTPLVGPISAGPFSLGAGAAGNGFFGSHNKFLTISRHHGQDQITDVIGSRHLIGAIDLTARARIPLIIAPRVATPDGKPATILMDLYVGPSIIGSETSLRSDQTFFNGADDTKRKTNVDVALLLGVAASKEIATAEVPLLGKIPVLARLFYQARFMPGNSVTQRSSFGFKEKVSTDSSTSHELGAELVIILTPRIIRGD